VVVNPSQFEVIRKSVKKTDRHDARALAKFLQRDLLPESRLKEKIRISRRAILVESAYKAPRAAKHPRIQY
jgi:hypothetical protein